MISLRVPRKNTRSSVRPTPVCRLLLLLLLAHCSLLTVFAGSWTRQRTNSLAWLHAIYFSDRDHGWAVGSRGTLLATNDGGRTWQAKPQPTEDAIRDIYFADEQNGWLACERNIYELRSNDEPRAYFMKTSDGGAHWKRVNLRGANVDTRLLRAIFSSGGRGWAFGEGGAIYTTRDSGASWIKLQAPTRYLLLGGTFIDENNGWLVGAGATILQTSDGGETWHQGRLPTPANVRFNSASFVDSVRGWAVGSGGAIYSTQNSGRNWQPQISGVTADLLDVKFVDAAEGWAVGAEGTVLHTNDGGLHWMSERSATPHALERTFFIDRSHGWAVGFGGTIISFDSSDRAEAPRLRR
ncbi:MAG TPA: YCF48-related protein [Pyrinomonadaceae bacterium]|nr:YCF48-related protein [Pyrinomonadaceae bacterium]